MRRRLLAVAVASVARAAPSLCPTASWVPTAACRDSASWHKRGAPAKDCAWVADYATRCAVVGEEDTVAYDACERACGCSAAPSAAPAPAPTGAAPTRAPSAPRPSAAPTAPNATAPAPSLPPSTAPPSRAPTPPPSYRTLGPTASRAPTPAPSTNETFHGSKKKKLHSLSPRVTFAAAAVLVFGGIAAIFALVLLLIGASQLKATITGPKPCLSPSEAARRGEFWSADGRDSFVQEHHHAVYE